MEVERLRESVSFAKENALAMSALVRKFCSFAEIESENEVLNISQIARTALKKKGYLLFEIPIWEKVIGAFCYKGDAIGYVVINTAIPRADANFALAHEIYHAFYSENECVSAVELPENGYYSLEELSANLFASMLLMPEAGFRKMYSKFKAEEKDNELGIIIKLMAYYQVPYMSALTRGCELGLLDNRNMSEELLEAGKEQIEKKFDDFWLDKSILMPSQKDDFKNIDALVEQVGQEYIAEGYLNERTLKKVRQNMREQYDLIKGVW